jgi:hypothetical protein
LKIGKRHNSPCPGRDNLSAHFNVCSLKFQEVSLKKSFLISASFLMFACSLAFGRVALAIDRAIPHVSASPAPVVSDVSMARVDHAPIFHAGALDVARPVVEPDDPLGRYRQSADKHQNFMDHNHSQGVHGATRTVFPNRGYEASSLRSPDYETGYKDRPAWSF